MLAGREWYKLACLISPCCRGSGIEMLLKLQILESIIRIAASSSYCPEAEWIAIP